MKNAFYENEADVKDYIYVNRTRHKTMPAHFHHNTELVFVLDGTLRVTVGGEERILTRGDLAVSSGCDVHFYEEIDKPEAFVLVAGGKYMAGVYAEFGFSFVRFLRCEAQFDALYAMFDALYTDFETLTDLEKLSAVAGLFGFLSRFYELKGEKRRANLTMVEVLRYLAANYARKLTIEAVAKQFGYTKTHFSMLFNRFTGMHFRTYINSLRLEATERAVLADIPVTKAALLCGFDSLNTYYRALKKNSTNS